MKQLFFAIPGDLSLATGGYGYDRRMIEEVRRLGWQVDPVRLPDGYPFPDPDDLAASDRVLDALPDGSLVLVDGLAFGAMPDLARRHRERLRLMALVHHPLGLEEGLRDEARRSLLQSERDALAHARTVVTTSVTTAKTLGADFGVPAERLHVAVPGTDRGTLAAGGNSPPVLVSVGSLIPRKGFDVLVEALATLTDLPWTCRIVGSKDRNRDCARDLADRIAVHDISERIHLAGEVPDTRAELARADLFVLASRFEGYGMAFAEALTQGLPVVGARAGAVPEVVTPDAGILVPPDDAIALAEALRPLLKDEGERRRWAQAARRAGERLPDWPEAGRRLAGILEEAHR